MVPSPGDVLRLLRLHTAAATASVPALVAFICGADPVPVAMTFIAGICHHAWGFSLNEILDQDVDRRADHLSEKPLISGRIGTKLAWAISIAALVLTFASMLGAVSMMGGSVLVVVCLLAASTACGTIYDIWSKKIPFMDIFVGLWFALLILTSAAAAGIPSDLITVISLVALASGLHLIFNNMIEGGLKDARTDRASGVRSAAVVLGVRSIGDTIVSPASFTAVALILRGAFIIALASLAGFAYTRGAHEAILIAVSVGGIALFAHSTIFIRSTLSIERTTLLRTFSIHEIASYILSIAAVSYSAGIPASIIAVSVPIIWFGLLNRLMYERTLAPRV